MGYLNLVGSFVYKEPLFRSKLAALANNDASLKTDGWAQNSKTLFFQAAVPSGWTQDVSQNDKALRVVGSTGGGVAGGTQALSSTISLSHTHSGIVNDGAHTHTLAAHTHPLGDSQTAGLSNKAYIDNGDGFLTIYNRTGGTFAADLYGGYADSPGALTLGFYTGHDHGGVTGSGLTNFVFAYCDVIVGTKNALAGTYTDLTSFWHTGDKIDFDPLANYANNDAYNYGALMPASTVMLFGQAAAPAGWTKIAGVNDRMLRIVSGAGGASGGTQLISSGVTLSHTHSLPASADHTHTVPAHQHLFVVVASSTTLTSATGGGSGKVIESIAGTHLAAELGSGTNSTKICYKHQTTNSGSGNTDATGAHTHTITNSLADFTLAYVDVIQCSKDSAGAPYSYTDYTSEFVWKKLVTYQRLNTLAKNDSYVQYHTTPVGSQAFFYMASPPTGWVKITSQHDKSLRIVSGGTGGSVGGGSQLLSATISLAHTHVIVAQTDHSHTFSHTHPIDSGSLPFITAATNNYAQASRSFLSPVGFLSVFDPAGGPGVAGSFDKVTQPSSGVTGLAGGHNHGGATNSQLTSVSLAYADVIWCVKS